MAYAKKPLDLFEAGQLIAGRYRVLDVIGAGAVGTVLRVSDQELDREVFALKVLHPLLAEDEKALGRFRNEILISRQLSHPNIVRVYDFDGSAQTRLYYLPMECVQGPNLRQYLDVCKGRRFGIEDAVRVLAHLLQALVFAHGKKVIHRDIKPENILLSRQGEAKLSDFGVAYTIQASIGFTATGEAIGTPAYMPPEAFRGEKLDARSDIYSLGIVAFEMLSGAPPFAEESFVKLAKRHLDEIPSPQPLFEAKAPGWLVQIVLRCLEKDRECRFGTCQEILEALKEHASETLVHPRLELKGRVRFSSGRWVNDFARYFFRILWWAIFLVVPVAVALPQNYAARKNLLRDIFYMEKALKRELPGVKAFFLFPECASRSGEKLHKAIVANDPVILRALPLPEPELDYADEHGNTLAHHAVVLGRFDRLAELAVVGAPLNNANKRGDRPLHLAIKAVNIDLVGTLRAANADPLLEDQNGDNALHLAARQGSEKLIREILDVGGYLYRTLVPPPSADKSTSRKILWQRSKSGKPPLHLAAEGLHFGAVETLLRSGADPNCVDEAGRTAVMTLFEACPPTRKAEAIGLARMLIAGGADPGIRDKNGRSAFDYARAASADF